MKCKIVLFYQDEDAMLKYVLQFYGMRHALHYKTHSEWLFEDEHFSIFCVRGISVGKSRKAHIVGVQEDLTWGDNWPRLRDCVLRPMLLSPIDIQIFDGVSRAEVERVDRER